MTQNPAMSGEKISEYDLNVVEVTDYGLSMEPIFVGKEMVPLQGARFDLKVDGRGRGRLAGRQQGFDYLRMRADGRMEFDLHVALETDDCHRIAYAMKAGLPAGSSAVARADGADELMPFPLSLVATTGLYRTTH